MNSLLEWRKKHEFVSTPEEHSKWFNSLNESSCIYRILEINNNPSAFVGFKFIEENHKRLYLTAYHIQKTHLNLMMNCILHYVFDVMNFEKVYCNIPVKNIRTIVFLLKFGFEIEGRLTNWLQYKDIRMDAYLISFNKSEFKNDTKLDYKFEI